MVTAISGLVVVAKAMLVQATSGSDWVANLLTAGGFAFLTAVVGGLALWNKNQSESAKSIAEGSREFVEGARIEILEARKEAREARKAASAAEAELEQLRDAYDDERRKFRRWTRQQKIANDLHDEWDGELVAKLKGLNVHIRDAPPLGAPLPDEDMS